jgi:hypothetical protein
MRFAQWKIDKWTCPGSFAQICFLGSLRDGTKSELRLHWARSCQK